jgi:hypothetical protein
LLKICKYEINITKSFHIQAYENFDKERCFVTHLEDPIPPISDSHPVVRVHPQFDLARLSLSLSHEPFAHPKNTQIKSYI